jgi:hypothetical protein
MLSAVLSNVDRISVSDDERVSGRISLSRKSYDVPQGQVVFNHDGNKGSGFYACTLYGLGHRRLLGAIEFNHQTGCWQVTHLHRSPYYDGISHLQYSEAVDFLMSQRLTA